VFDIDVSRHQPALQLVGRQDYTLDLGRLQDRGVRLVGRAVAASGHQVSFDDQLIASIVAADIKLSGLRERIDAYAARAGLSDVPAAEPFVPLWPRFIAQAGSATIDLRAEGIGTVLWATGFRRSYPWLHVPVLDGCGEITHTGGVTAAPGIYVLGLQFQRRRKSAFIDGVGGDAEHLADQIVRRGPRRASHAEVTDSCWQPRA
jgi:putative flavoprotein involved in K+ transport